jgi:hypothetical protein
MNMKTIALLLLCASGCGGGECGSCFPTRDIAAGAVDLSFGDLSSGGDQAAPLADLATSDPAGPYGSATGATFPLLAWQGYVDDAGDVIANTRPYVAYDSDSLRRSGRPYALVHLSAEY